VRRRSDSIEPVVWLGHLLLAVALGPLAALSDAVSLPSAVWYAVLLVYVVSPFLGYLWSMRGHGGGLRDDAPCERTGTVLGWHWFEFPTGDGARWWTRDDAVAAAIRACRVALPMQGMELDVKPSPSPRKDAQPLWMVKNLAVVSVSMTLGYFAMLVGAVLRDGGLSDLGSVLGGGMFCLLLGLMPPLLFVWVGYLGTFMGAWALWHRALVPSETASIRWTGPQLRTERGTVYVDEPGTTVALTYDAFGTALAVDDGKERLVLRGPHALLAPLADALWARRAQGDDAGQDAAEAQAWTSAVRTRAREIR